MVRFQHIPMGATCASGSGRCVTRHFVVEEIVGQRNRIGQARLTLHRARIASVRWAAYSSSKAPV